MVLTLINATYDCRIWVCNHIVGVNKSFKLYKHQLISSVCTLMLVLPVHARCISVLRSVNRSRASASSTIIKLCPFRGLVYRALHKMRDISGSAQQDTVQWTTRLTSHKYQEVQVKRAECSEDNCTSVCDIADCAEAPLLTV